MSAEVFSEAMGLIGEKYIMEAVTYQQKILGYPFYYETSALLYNMTYLEELAKKEIQEELKDTLQSQTQGSHIVQ